MQVKLLSPVVEVTSWLSNLLKANLVKEEEKRIIDYNHVISEKLAEIRKTLLVEGGDFQEPSGEFVMGLQAETVELEPQPDPQEELEKARAIAEELVKNARAEAEQIQNQAQEEAARLRAQEQEAGRQEGYAEGSAKAQAELDIMRQQLLEEENRRQEEYKQRLAVMEEELVDVILQVVSHVTMASITEKKDIIFHLIENSLEHIESSKQFLIHVSKEDYQVLIEQKEFLLAQVPQSTELEIIKDAALTPGQCMIETDGGVFDCGLDTRLNSLAADIKALSMQ